MVAFSVDGTTVAYVTRPDLFSPKGLDKGSQALLETVAKQSYESALDWGCGWGSLGLWLASRNPKAQVIALDSDMSAIKATRLNVGHNGLKNLTVTASTGYDDIDEDSRFDLIVSNPPTHRGREVVETMIADSRARLTPGGILVIVVEARLKPWVQRSLDAQFGSCEVIRRTNKHVVLSAQS